LLRLPEGRLAKTIDVPGSPPSCLPSGRRGDDRTYRNDEFINELSNFYGDDRAYRNYLIRNGGNGFCLLNKKAQETLIC